MLRRPSTAAFAAGLGESEVGARFARDTPLEGAGFEPSVPFADWGRFRTSALRRVPQPALVSFRSLAGGGKRIRTLSPAVNSEAGRIPSRRPRTVIAALAKKG